jgi:hypothetical protein
VAFKDFGQSGTEFIMYIVLKHYEDFDFSDQEDEQE